MLVKLRMQQALPLPSCSALSQVFRGGSPAVLFYAEGFARDGTGFACQEYQICPPRRRPLSYGSEVRQGGGASLIVADQSPLRLGRTWRVAIAAALRIARCTKSMHTILSQCGKRAKSSKLVLVLFEES